MLRLGAFLGPPGESSLGKEGEEIWGRGRSTERRPLPGHGLSVSHTSTRPLPREVYSWDLANTVPQLLKMQVILGRLCAGAVNTPWACSGEKRVAWESAALEGRVDLGGGAVGWGRSRQALPGPDAHGRTCLTCPLVGGYTQLGRCSVLTQPQILPAVSLRPHSSECLRVPAGNRWLHSPALSTPVTSTCGPPPHL